MAISTMLTVNINGADKEVRARELTAGEIRDLIAKAEAKSKKPPKNGGFELGDVLFEDVTFDDLECITNLTRKELLAMAPSELRKVADACVEVNATFFAMLQRMQAALQKQLEQLIKTPPGPPMPQEQSALRDLSRH